MGSICLKAVPLLAICVMISAICSPFADFLCGVNYCEAFGVSTFLQNPMLLAAFLAVSQSHFLRFAQVMCLS